MSGRREEEWELFWVVVDYMTGEDQATHFPALPSARFYSFLNERVEM